MDAVDTIIDGSRFEISAILLFGSQVTGKTTHRSDIDICVVFAEDVNVREATLFRKRLLGKLRSNIDLQVFSTLPLTVKKQIADRHEVLYSSDRFDDFLFTRRYQKLFTEHRHRIAAAGL